MSNYTDLFHTIMGMIRGDKYDTANELVHAIIETVQDAQAPASGEVEPVAWECSGEPGLHTDVVTSESAAAHYRKLGRTVRPLIYADIRPPASQVPEACREAALGAKRFAEDPKMVLAQPQTAAAHIRGLAELILTTPGNAPQPAQQGSVPEEYRQALQDAYDIIVSDANTPENYGSLCRIGAVLGRISGKSQPTADQEGKGDE